jgi:hypothetical protein
MNTFYEHHQDSSGSDTAALIAFLLNGLIQPLSSRARGRLPQHLLGTCTRWTTGTTFR